MNPQRRNIQRVQEDGEQRYKAFKFLRWGLVVFVYVEYIQDHETLSVEGKTRAAYGDAEMASKALNKLDSQESSVPADGHTTSRKSPSSPIPLDIDTNSAISRVSSSLVNFELKPQEYLDPKDTWKRWNSCFREIGCLRRKEFPRTTLQWPEMVTSQRSLGQDWLSTAREQ